MSFLQRVRSFARFAKRTLLSRPSGLKRFGKGAAVMMPRKLYGKQHISIGANSTIMQGSRIEAISHYSGRIFTPMVAIGENVYVGRYVFLTAIQGVRIGDGCVFSDYVYITDSSHGLDPAKGPIMLQELESKGPVSIGPHCFLGYRVVVMPGVTLGERCVVGANSVVTRSFPSYSMVAGSPARLIKRYSQERKRWDITL